VDGRSVGFNAVMADIGLSLLTAFDFVWDRFTTRIAGLTDEEYRWQPTAPADADPVPTVEWRIAHIAEALVTFADRLFPDRDPGSPPPVPGDAGDVPAFLDASYRRWRSGLAELTEEQLGTVLGAAWGPYATSTATDVALHVFDELVHHGAEVALLRDLYARRNGERRT
jgi:hypothetical protein